MNFCTETSLFALMLAACLPSKSDRVIPPRDINQAVIDVEDWDMGCDNLGVCVAIGARPPRKIKMNGNRGALRITFRPGKEPELTIIPLDFEQRLPDVTPTASQSAILLKKLRGGHEFMLLHDDADGTRYYLPGEHFDLLEDLYRRWLKAYPVRLVQQEPVIPTKGIELGGFLVPKLSDAQLAECDAPDKGSVEAVWEIGGNYRLFRYACSAKGRFHAEKLWFTMDNGSNKISAIGIKEAVGPKTDGKAAGLYNTYFEPSQGLLVTRKLAGSDDCGLVAVYAANGSGFTLAERREVRHCVGLFAGDWVRTYRDPSIIMPEHW